MEQPQANYYNCSQT